MNLIIRETCSLIYSTKHVLYVMYMYVCMYVCNMCNFSISHYALIAYQPVLC